jgi:PAS domain S-box-containing protein
MLTMLKTRTYESLLDCGVRGRDENPALLRLSDRFMLFGGIPLLLALIAAGLAGNHFNYPIFLNIDFLFGSIFAMLALQFFGLGRGIIAAAAIAGYTYIIWNHPYAIVIMTTEVAVVGFLMTRRKMGMVLADTLYWVIIGMPLVYLFYHVVMHVPPSNTYIIMTKQTINGIANALIARMVFTGCLLRSRSVQGAYNEVIYNLLAFFVLCPSLVLLAVSSRTDFAETDTNIRSTLISTGTQLELKLKTWQYNRITTLQKLADMAATSSPQQIQPFLEFAKKSDVNFNRIGVMSRDAITTAYFPIFDEAGKSNIGKNYADRSYIPVLKQTLKPLLSEVVISRIGMPKPTFGIFVPVVTHGEYNGYVTGNLALEQLQASFSITTKQHATFFTLLDKNGNIIMTNRSGQKVMSPLVRENGTLKHQGDGISAWVPTLPPNIPVSERWKKTFYVAETEIGDQAEWKLILEQPVAPFQKKLYDNYSGKLMLLLMILLTSLGIAEIVSRRSIALLQESEERFRNMFYNHSAIMLLIDPASGKIIDVNLAAEQFYGYSRINLLAMNIIDINQLSPEHVQAERTLALESQSNYFIFPHRLANGETRTVEVHSTPITISATKLLFSIVHDISERKQAEEALQLSEEKLSAMVSNISDVIGIIGVDGYMKYKSSNIEKWFGWQPHDLIGTDGWLTVHPEDLERIQKEFIALLEKDNSVKRVEYRYKCKDGSYKPIHLTATNLVNNPVINGVLLNYHDISERKQAEEALHQSKILAEAAAQAKSRFLAIVAHEFHTPLHLLTISTDILEQYEGCLTTEEQYDQHTQIRNAARQLSSLIDSVSVYNRQEREFKFSAPELLDIGQICTTIFDEVSRVWGHDHTFQADISSDCGTGIFCEVLFRRLLENLLTNAYRFTPPGGSVSLRVNRQGDRLLIEVADTGIGIPEEDQERIYDAFYRSSNVDARRGLGLGLSIVKDALQTLNGSISLISSAGQGTTFRVELPVINTSVSEGPLPCTQS